MLAKDVKNGRYQRQNGSGRLRARKKREDRTIVRDAVTSLDSSLSIIHLVARTRMSNVTLHRRFRERNLRSC
ncbi:hypothetical protein TNCV_617411 [Trichonephila clavipes]|nr:hypothetical protein TNCV_617411 [Trichonephila clavipes]